MQPPHCSHSDVNTVPVTSAVVDLLPSLPVLKAPDATTDDSSAALKNLTKLVLDQHHMLCELKDRQEKSMLVLQEQIKELKVSVLGEQKAGLSEMCLDQRILEHANVRAYFNTSMHT